MNCPKCGVELESGDRFCTACGTPIDEQPAVPNQREVESLAKQQPRKKLAYKSITIIICIVLVVALSAGMYFIFYNGNGKPETVTEKCFNAMLNYDYDTFSKYYALDISNVMRDLIAGESSTAPLSSSAPLSDSEVNQLLNEKFGTTDIRTIFEDDLKASETQYIKEQIGSDAKITVSVNGTTSLPKSQIDLAITDISSSFKEYYGINLSSLINLSDIQTMCVVQGNVTIKGSVKFQTYDIATCCVKIGGKWNVLDTLRPMSQSSPYLSPLMFLDGLAYTFITNS